MKEDESILGNTAKRQSSPRVNDSEWINRMLSHIWSMADLDAVYPVIEDLEGSIAEVLPGFVISVKLSEIKLGTYPPIVSNLVTLDNNSGEKTLNIKFDLLISSRSPFAQRKSGESYLSVLATALVGFNGYYKPLQIWISLKHLRATVILSTDFVSVAPYVHTSRISLLGTPDIDVSASPLGIVDVMKLPIIKSIILLITKGTINKMMRYPHTYTLKLSQILYENELLLPPPAVGLLRIDIKSAILMKYIERRSGLFVEIYLKGEQCALARTSTFHRTVFPALEETVYIPIFNRDIESKSIICINLCAVTNGMSIVLEKKEYHINVLVGLCEAKPFGGWVDLCSENTPNLLETKDADSQKVHTNSKSTSVINRKKARLRPVHTGKGHPNGASLRTTRLKEISPKKGRQRKSHLKTSSPKDVIVKMDHTKASPESCPICVCPAKTYAEALTISEVNQVCSNHLLINCWISFSRCAINTSGGPTELDVSTFTSAILSVMLHRATNLYLGLEKSAPMSAFAEVQVNNSVFITEKKIGDRNPKWKKTGDFTLLSWRHSAVTVTIKDSTPKECIIGTVMLPLKSALSRSTKELVASRRLELSGGLGGGSVYLTTRISPISIKERFPLLGPQGVVLNVSDVNVYPAKALHPLLHPTIEETRHYLSDNPTILVNTLDGRTPGPGSESERLVIKNRFTSKIRIEVALRDYKDKLRAFLVVKRLAPNVLYNVSLILRAPCKLGHLCEDPPGPCVHMYPASVLLDTESSPSESPDSLIPLTERTKSVRADKEILLCPKERGEVAAYNLVPVKKHTSVNAATLPAADAACEYPLIRFKAILLPLGSQ